MSEQPSSNEFYYLDENGRKSDLELHADMLDEDEIRELRELQREEQQAPGAGSAKD